MSVSAHAIAPINICMTGKIELMLPIYKTAFMNGVNLALSQSAKRNQVSIKTYFFDNEPLAAIKAYNKMVRDHCAAIIGFEYLSDLLLVEKIQHDNNIPIFTSYSSSNDNDHIAKNIFMFMPTYDFHARKMMEYLHNKFNDISNVLIITEVDRPDLAKYKTAYEKIFVQKGIDYDTLDFIGNDTQFENKLKKFTKNRAYNVVFVLSGAVGSTKIINHMNDHKTTFIGTENFGSSSNQSLFVRLNDKKINSFIIRNIDFIKNSSPLQKFKTEYVQKYSILPSPLSTYTYDAMMIILKTLEHHDILTINDILNTSFSGITGAIIKDNKFYRSNQYVILSIDENGFIYEQ